MSPETSDARRQAASAIRRYRDRVELVAALASMALAGGAIAYWGLDEVNGLLWWAALAGVGLAGVAGMAAAKLLMRGLPPPDWPTE